MWEVLGSWSIHSTDDNMVSFVWLEGDSLDWSEFLLLKLFDLGGVDDLWGESRINAGSLDGNDKVASVLDELGGVETENTSLIWLGNICEDNVDHWHKHSIFLWMSGVLDDWNDVGSLLGHVDEVSAGSLGELDGVDASLWANQVGDVGNGCSGSSTKVENLAAWLHVDVTNTTNDSGGNLGSEWVPNSILSFSTGFFLLKTSKSKDMSLKFRNKNEG